MKRSSVVILAALVASFSVVGSSFALLGYTTAMVWLGMDPGGRPSGMGKAFVGVADDSNATYYNPGGLPFATEREISFMHEPRSVTGGPSDFYYDYGSFILPTQRFGTFGIGFLYHEMGKSEARDKQGNLTGIIHSYGFAPWLSYGYGVLDSLGVGGSLRYAYEHLADVEGGTATAVTFDLGLLYKVPFPFGKLNLGLSFLNLGPDIRGGESESTPSSENGGDASPSKLKPTIHKGEPMPRRVQLGLGWKIMEDEMNDLLFAFDVSKELVALDDGFSKELRQTVQRIGMEYFYRDIVGFRVGYYRDHYGEITGVTAGFGVCYYGFKFDYAHIPEGEAFGSENRFSLSYIF